MATCIVCVMGLPASGKTSFCKRLITFLHSQKENVNHLYICFDDIFSLEEQKLLIIENKWKQGRRCLTELVESLLNAALKKEFLPLDENAFLLNKIKMIKTNDFLQQTNQNNVIIIDDNLYYRSMRYEFFQVAKKYGCGFCEIYIKCPTEKALERNLNRENRVQSEVILNMATKLEEPCPQKHTWEISLTVASDNDIPEIENARTLILNALHNPANLPLDDHVYKQESQLVTLTSVIHQVDVVLRNIVGEKIKNYQVSGSHTTEDIKLFSKNVNALRQEVISNIKKEKMSLPQTVIEWIELGRRDMYFPCLHSILTTTLDEAMVIK